MKNAIIATAAIRKNRMTGVEFIDVDSISEGCFDSPTNARAKAEIHARFNPDFASDNPIVRTASVVVGEATDRQIATRRF